jgi:transposase, IS5 family
MGQPGFFDADKRLAALSAKGDPLEAIDRLVPWESFRVDIEAVVLTPEEMRKSGAGRKPLDAIVMFRMLVLQALNNLSDEQAEYQVRDRLSFTRFLRLGIEDSIPDATTLWLFREKLAKAGLIEKLFDRFDQHLAAKGYMARGGQIVDATIVPVPTQRNSRDENEAVKAGRIPQEWYNKPAKLRQKDRDARWTKRHGRSFFGYKNHVNADAKHKLIRRYEVTDAAVHDSQKLDELLTKGNTSADVFGDSAIAHARSRSDCAPAASRAVFMCGPLANARSRKRKRMRTATEAKFAPASSTCSQLNRPRWAAESYARSASCERAPKLACRTWPTTFAAL